LRDNLNISEIYSAEEGSHWAMVLNRAFDSAIGLDVSGGVGDLANLVKAQEKFGIGIDLQGDPFALGPNAESLLCYAKSPPDFAVKHQSTYQSALAQALHLPEIEKSEMVFQPSAKSIAFCSKFLEDNQLHPGKKPIVLIHLSVDPRYPARYYSPRFISFLAEYLLQRSGVEVIIAGGAKEKELVEICLSQSPPPVNNGKALSAYSDTIGLILASDLVIAQNSLTLHLALALGKKAVMLPCATSACEIEFYGRGKAPEFEKAMEELTTEEVYAEIAKMI
jgi:ADP-heptose:LPS heptosyltransferase